MKKIHFSLAFVLISLFAHAQWVQVNGPKDSFIAQEMVVKDSLLLLSTTGGSFFSTDTGAVWKPAMAESFTGSVLYHDTIFTGGESYPGSGPSNTIRKMVFAGGSWQPVSVFENPGPVKELFTDGNTVFVASASDGSYEEAGFICSADGKNWVKYNTGLPKDSILGWGGYTYVYDLYAISANQQYVFTGTKKGLYRSPKSTYAWSVKNAGLPAEKVSAIFSNDTLLIIAIRNQLYKSADQGESWGMIFTFSTGNTVNRIKLINDTLFALTETGGIYRSADGGASWSTANNGLTSLRTRCLVKQGAEYLMGGGAGVAKGLDHWVAANSNIVCSNVRDLDQNASCLAAIEMQQVFISKDEGLTWNQTTPYLSPGVMWSVTSVNGCLFFSFAPAWPADCINYRSCDNGDTWTMTTPLTNYGDPYTLRSNGSKMIAYTDNVIFISSDNGTTWLNISPPSGMMMNDFSDVLFTGDDLYISANYFMAEVIHSADFGVTWNRCDTGLGQNNIYKLATAGGSLFAFSPTALFRSEDKGQTWLACKALGDEVQDVASDGDMIFACKYTQVYMSRDMGTTWTDISAGLPPLPHLWGGTLMVRDHFLWFGTYTFGIWKTGTGNLPSTANNLSSGPDFELYPNPAGNEINIVSKGDHQITRVDILDFSGRVILSGKFSGNKLETESLAPNLYLLRIETTDQGVCYKKFVKH